MYMLLCCREEAQKCYCGSANCRGILGGPPPKDNRKAGLYMQMSYLYEYTSVVVIFMCLCAGEFGIRRERRRREGVIVDTLDEVSHQANP